MDKPDVKLLPCPFCGEQAVQLEDNVYDRNLGSMPMSKISCTECAVGTEWFDFKPYSIKTWNTRTPTEQTEKGE